MIWNTSELSASHLSCAKAIFVVDCCKFGPIWMFGLKMELMACASLVGCTTDQSYIFSWPYMIVSMIWNTSELSASHLSRAQPFLLLIAANLALAGSLGWKCSLWHVPTWLAVQRSKSIFFMTLNVSITDMKHFLTFWITPQPCHSHFCCWLLPIWP